MDQHDDPRRYLTELRQAWWSLEEVALRYSRWRPALSDLDLLYTLESVVEDRMSSGPHDDRLFARTVEDLFVKLVEAGLELPYDEHSYGYDLEAVVGLLEEVGE